MYVFTKVIKNQFFLIANIKYIIKNIKRKNILHLSSFKKLTAKINKISLNKKFSPRKKSCASSISFNKYLKNKISNASYIKILTTKQC